MKKFPDVVNSNDSRSILKKNHRSVADLDWVLILNKPKLLYVETPKAACTKIRTLLILLNRGYDDPELAEFLQTVKPAPYYHWEFG
ncbi:MAG: hypothetical protein F6K41_24590, partial [Symploca sp. SIO3E6]|nr:hypothetical protein [Caldora sp. SIO3E6]